MTNNGQYSFGLRMGEREFQVSGDRAFVEAQTEKWLLLFKDQLPAELNPTTAANAASAGAAQAGSNAARKLPTLAEFIKTKEPREVSDMILVVGLYMERFQQKNLFKASELMEMVFNRLNRSEAEVKENLDKLTEKQFLNATETMGSTELSYSLTFTGEQVVKEGFHPPD